MTHNAKETTARILLVEDDAADQELTRRAMEDGRLKVDLAVVQDGEEAMDYLLHREQYSRPGCAPRPDLILLDLNLPKLDGKQVLRAIRAHPDLRRIPVVVLTTSKREEDVIRTYDLGVSSYITKPLDMDDFVTTLRELGNYWFRVVVLPPGEECSL